MAYEVLARKWRPQQFADVVGQEHVTRTLANAIRAIHCLDRALVDEHVLLIRILRRGPIEWASANFWRWRLPRLIGHRLRRALGRSLSAAHRRRSGMLP